MHVAPLKTNTYILKNRAAHAYKSPPVLVILLLLPVFRHRWIHSCQNTNWTLRRINLYVQWKQNYLVDIKPHHLPLSEQSLCFLLDLSVTVMMQCFEGPPLTDVHPVKHLSCCDGCDGESDGQQERVLALAIFHSIASNTGKINQVPWVCWCEGK